MPNEDYSLWKPFEYIGGFYTFIFFSIFIIPKIFIINYDGNLYKSLGLVFFGNFLIAIITQWLSYKIEKNEAKVVDTVYYKELGDIILSSPFSFRVNMPGPDLEKTETKSDTLEAQFKKIKRELEDFLFRDLTDCLIRCSAGILEMLLYTIFFAIGMGTISIGYLVLKNISVWKPKDSKNSEEDSLRHYTKSKKEGLHTAVLRISTVLQFIFSLFAAYFLFYFLKDNFPSVLELTKYFTSAK